MKVLVKEISNLVVTPIVIVSAVTYLTKKFVESYFKYREKAFESTLKLHVEKEIHDYKTSVDNENLRFKTKIAGIYEKQAEIVIKTHQYLADLQRLMNNAINFGEPGSTEYKEFRATYLEFKIYYERNQLLLPKCTDAPIKAFLDDTFWSIEDYESGERRLAVGVSEETIDNAIEKKNKAVELSKSIPQIKDQLTVTFREKIGVE